MVLPLAYAIGIFFNVGLCWYMFERDYPGFTRNIKANLFQSTGAALIMGYATYLSLGFFSKIFGLSTVFGVFMQGFCAGIVGIIVGVIVLVLLKNKEIREVWDTLHRKFWKAKVVVPEVEHI
jgi:hypothetical protein